MSVRSQLGSHRPTISSRTACPTCGSGDDQEAVGVLEHELRSLTDKYLTAVNQLRELQEQYRRPPPTRAASSDGTSASDAGLHAHSQSIDATNNNETPSRPTALTRLASFGRLGSGILSTSSSISNSLGTTPVPPTGPDVNELQKELARETAARLAAEKKVATVNSELEDLSAQLFEQANQMVASERKANASMQERVAVLEKRDKEKSRRLERIETAHKRIERARKILDAGPAG